SPPPAAAPDLEQWFGQRGLLIVGVLALLTAAGFFLKYAIDRGWIAPLVRSLLAIAAGIAVAAWGEARVRAGLRRYGAAMIGAGGGLVYLGLWAAAGPYGLLERRIGVLLLAACTVAVTLLALRHERSEEQRLNSSHVAISYAVFCLKKKKNMMINSI